MASISDRGSSAASIMSSSTNSSDSPSHGGRKGFSLFGKRSDVDLSSLSTAPSSKPSSSSKHKSRNFDPLRPDLWPQAPPSKPKRKEYFDPLRPDKWPTAKENASSKRNSTVPTLSKNSSNRYSTVPTEALDRKYFNNTPSPGSLAPSLGAMSFDQEETSSEVPSYALFAPKAKVKALAVTGTKLAGKTPLWELPSTWEDYAVLYGKNEMDIEDPPAPPTRRAMEATARRPLPPTPFDEGVWAAPLPSNELLRQAFVAELDLHGTRGATASLESHPAFRHVVQKCRETFGTSAVMLSILDDDTQRFLSTSGLPAGVASLPRDVTFCTHTILNEDRGLVVLDSKKDWRFSKNVPASVMSTRFYAGAPVMAPSFGLENTPDIAIGTLAILHDRPSDGFNVRQRDMLRELAAEVTREIEGYVNSGKGDKLARLTELYTHAKNNSLPLAPPPYTSMTKATTRATSEFPAPPPRSRPTSSLPRTPPRSLHSKPSSESIPAEQINRRDSVRSQPSLSNDAASTRSSATATATATVAPALPPPSRIEAPSPAAPVVIGKDVQKVFDTATKMLGKSLDLPFVYLIQIDLTTGASHRLSLLSSTGLPSPPPDFDPLLHFNALRAPEGGIFHRSKSGKAAFSSGILIPVREVRKSGYVLAGYSNDVEREMGEREMKYFAKFAVNLETWVSRVGQA
ncbi:hypothetical protein RQP46_005642 [Phenoliferia psychrophenolica]